jgi:predicted ATPase
MATPGLVGRSRELADVEARTTEHRLVTIVGPGGVGKTALGRAAAGRLAGSFPAGVHHVDLTRTDDPSSVPGSLSAQLGFDSFDALLSSPNDRPVLLVVDNCEHLLDVVASTVVAVLGACHQTAVLATSRAPLEVPGESIVALAPLPLPEGDDDSRSCPAVALFLGRCHDAGVEFGDVDLPRVVELCRRLDGLPLALEIAAARTRMLSLDEIIRRLDDSVEVLDRPRFRGDPRHRGLTDAIRWSYDLLSPHAAATLEQLAVCAGPFEASTARAIALPQQHVDASLDELVTVSLMTADTSGSDTQYRLLDSVRRFGLEQLRRRGATDDAYGRFVDHVSTRCRELLDGAASEWRPDLLRDVVAAFDDISEAMRWCIAHDDDPRRAHQLASPLWPIVHQGHADDIVELMRRLIDRFPDRHSRGAANAVAVLATAEYVSGHPDTAHELAESIRATHRGDDIPAVLVCRVLGQTRNALGDFDGAIAVFDEGTGLGRRIGATAMADELVVAREQVAADAGDVDQARTHLDELLARTDPPLSSIVASWAQTTRTWIHARTDPAAALTAATDALATARALDYPIAVAVNLRTKAFAELLLDDPGSAVRTLVELRDELRRRGAISNARVLVEPAAALAYRLDHPSWPRLAATARALPITTIACSHFEMIPVPDVNGGPFGRHDVFAVVGHVLAELQHMPSPSDQAGSAVGSPVEREATLDRRGDLVEFDFSGRSIAVRASKGINDIVRLIAAGGTELHCLDLVGAAVQQNSTGELIDAAARRRYEERIRELQAEIEQAEHDNDYTRSYRYQVELDQLIDHLTAAVGHGGRRRRAADSAERARSSVTHRIRSSIRQLERLHPTLGRHLAHSITTGLYCSYRPETPVVWRVGSDDGRTAG